MGEAYVILPDAGESLELGNFRGEVLAAGPEVGQEFSLLKTIAEPPGFGPPLHRHADAAEAFYVLEGEYLMYLEEDRRRCPQGSFVYVPPGVAHTFQVVSSTPGTKLNLFTPAAMIGFFRALAESEAAGTATPELLGEIASRHHMEILGPVPESYL